MYCMHARLLVAKFEGAFFSTCTHTHSQPASCNLTTFGAVFVSTQLFFLLAQIFFFSIIIIFFTSVYFLFFHTFFVVANLYSATIHWILTLQHQIVSRSPKKKKDLITRSLSCWFISCRIFLFIHVAL